MKKSIKYKTISIVYTIIEKNGYLKLIYKL